jgi:septum formation protein
MTGRNHLILASASPRRSELLAQIGIEPAAVVATAIDESPRRGELPHDTALRLAKEKAEAACTRLAPDQSGALVLAADTVVAVGRRLLGQADTADEATRFLELLSGRAHRVFTGVAVATPGGQVRSRVVESRVKFKRLAHEEIASYIASNEWRGKAGGYAIQGLAAAFVTQLIGSYSNVVGLPLAETAAMLGGEGYPVRGRWADGGNV